MERQNKEDRMNRMEELIYNKNWPWIYCKDKFMAKGQKHIPQDITTRKSMNNPKPYKAE